MSDLAKTIEAQLSSRSGAVVDMPFGPEVRVWKVAGKMFALMSAARPTSVSLKCDPHLAEILRETYSGITAGYHLNKRHWNSIAFDGSVPAAEILRLCDHSYDLVRASLTKAQRATLA
jgi:predicted DNA-binding protein (MmcQ/YjbR family)